MASRFSYRHLLKIGWLTTEALEYLKSIEKSKCFRSLSVDLNENVSHQPARRREHKKQGFMSVGSAQRFLSIHAAAQNTFSVPSHLSKNAPIRQGIGPADVA